MIRSFLASDTVFTTNGEKIIQPIKCIEHREYLDWYIDLTASLENQPFLQNDMILVVDTKEKGPQPFRIKNPRITSKIEVRAYHIGFDTLNHACELSTVFNQNCIGAMTTLLANSEDTNNFVLFSNITTLKSFSIIDKNLFEGFLQIAEEYNGTLDFDGWQIRITTSIGTDRGVVLAYGKNIQESEINENWDLVVTKLKPIGNEGITLTPEWLNADITYERPYTKIMKFDTDDLSNLALIAQLYLDRYKHPRVNYKIKADVEQNVGLGDSIVVRARQFTIMTEILSFDYNVLTRRVEAIEFGNFRPTLKNYFSELTQQAEEKAVKRAQVKIDDIDGRITQIVTDVTGIGSQLEQTSNQFSLTFSKTLHEMKNKLVYLDTIHMYGSETGTNIGFTEISVSVPEVYFFSTNQGTNEYYFMPHNEVSLYGLKRGDPYTFSATMISEATPSNAQPATDVGVSIYYYTDASLPPLLLVGKNFKSIDEEILTSLTFTLPMNAIGWYMKLEVNWSLSGSYTFMHFHMKNAQLEQGGVVTEFSNNMSTISGAKYVFNGENASFFNGGLKVYNKDNVQVFGGDTNGDLWTRSLLINGGELKVLGNANENRFKTRGIQGISADGNSLSGLYLNFGNTNPVYINGLNTAWHEGNFNPNEYLPKSGGSITGSLTIENNQELRLRASIGSTDAGDIVWIEGDGNEQHRIWGSTGLEPTLYYRYKSGPTRKIFHDGNLDPFYLYRNTGKAIESINASALSPDAWNILPNTNLKLTNNNNSLAIVVGGTLNNRNAIIQVGHESTNFSNVLGALNLNPFGGSVFINQQIAYHAGNVATLTPGNGINGSSFNLSTARTWSIGGGVGITTEATGVRLTDIVAGSGIVGALKYNGTSRLAGTMYGGSTVPSSTVSLNYDGIFWAQGLRYGASGSSSYSDIRMKKDVGSLNYAVDLILSLIPKQFRYRNEFEAPEEVIPSKINAEIPTSRTTNRGRLHYGLIAQDVEKVLNKIGIDRSALIKEPNQDTDFYGLDYTQLIAPMIATIQYLEKRILLLENQKGENYV